MQKAKEETGADYCVVVLGADFAQRGALSLISRHTRTRMALKSGADLVVALPVQPSSAAALDFARGAAGILEGLGCIDFISFGSESGDINALAQTADNLKQARHNKNTVLQEALKAGQPYAKALGDSLGGLCKPNDILGVEYINALEYFNSKISPHTVKREGDYHGLEYGAVFYSAGKIRAVLADLVNESKSAGHNLYDDIASRLPKQSLSLIERSISSNEYLLPDDISPYTSYALWECLYRGYALTDISGISPFLANRIRSKASEFVSFSQFCSLLKSKNFTYTSIARGLIRLTLGIGVSDMELYKNAGYAPFVRILGFRKSAAPLLSNVKKNSNIPVISKAADYKKMLGLNSQGLFLQDVCAADLYSKIIATKYNVSLRTSDLAREIVVL